MQAMCMCMCMCMHRIACAKAMHICEHRADLSEDLAVGKWREWR